MNMKSAPAVPGTSADFDTDAYVTCNSVSPIANPDVAGYCYVSQSFVNIPTLEDHTYQGNGRCSCDGVYPPSMAGPLPIDSGVLGTACKAQCESTSGCTGFSLWPDAAGEGNYGCRMYFFSMSTGTSLPSVPGFTEDDTSDQNYSGTCEAVSPMPDSGNGYCYVSLPPATKEVKFDMTLGMTVTEFNAQKEYIKQGIANKFGLPIDRVDVSVKQRRRNLRRVLSTTDLEVTLQTTDAESSAVVDIMGETDFADTLEKDINDAIPGSDTFALSNISTTPSVTEIS